MTTDSNASDLNASNNGVVNIYNNDVDVQNNLIVQGTITADNLNTSARLLVQNLQPIC